MGYLTDEQIKEIGFGFVGKNVKISDRASIYNANHIEIDDDSRIDDFCLVSGRVRIGRFCHITPQCLIAGGSPGVFVSDFCTFAYGVKVFAQSDDYSGKTMANSLVPKKYKDEFLAPVFIERQVIIGAGSIVFPGVRLGQGCSVGALSLVRESTEPWGMYVGSPARRIKERSRELLKLEEQFLGEMS